MSTGCKTNVLPQERTKKGGYRQPGMSLAYARKSLSTTIYKPFTPNEYDHRPRRLKACHYKVQERLHRFNRLQWQLSGNTVSRPGQKKCPTHKTWTGKKR
eukprot:1136244-Pelagomonas_calceolata.AAC.1